MRKSNAAPRPIALALLSLSCAAVATAGDVSLGANVELLSSYVWRGVELDSGWSLQPELIFGWQVSESTGLELSSFWNLPLEDHGSPDHKDLLYEQDFTFSVAHSLSDAVELSGGAITYDNPRSDVEPGSEAWRTTELFLSASVGGEHGFLEATASADVDAVKGWFWDLGGGWSVPLRGALTLDGEAHVGFASGMDPNPTDPGECAYFTDDGLVSTTMTLGFGWSFKERLTFGAAVNQAFRFDDYGTSELEDESFTWLTVSAGYSF